MSNPVIVEITRGGVVESRHRGAYAVVDSAGKLIASAGNIAAEVFPRSAIKAFQCLPVVESGAADRFAFTDEELALACASHAGEAEHVRVARQMLAKTGNIEADYECGTHWPTDSHALHDMVRAGKEPGPVHNNCSGKHAGMLALARQLGVDSHGYTKVVHPVQQAIAKTIGELCNIDLGQQPWGIDGCSVPTWAIPLRNLALGFARFTTRGPAAGRIVAAVRAHPFMVAGTGLFCTRLMRAVPRVFVKGGAEGVHCGAIPHAGLGIALKCDDGAGRAAEAAMAAILAGLDVWMPDEAKTLKSFADVPLTNRRHIHVGDVHAVIG
jgi:L-asparaginase II